MAGGIRVKAEREGYFDNKIRDPGAKFEIQKASEKGAWMSIHPEDLGKFELAKKNEAVGNAKAKLDAAKKAEVDKKAVEAQAKKAADEEAKALEAAKKKQAEEDALVNKDLI